MTRARDADKRLPTESQYSLSLCTFQFKQTHSSMAAPPPPSLLFSFFFFFEARRSAAALARAQRATFLLQTATKLSLFVIIVLTKRRPDAPRSPLSRREQTGSRRLVGGADNSSTYAPPFRFFRNRSQQLSRFIKRTQDMHAAPLVWEQHAPQQTHICEPAESPRAGSPLG